MLPRRYPNEVGSMAVITAKTVANAKPRSTRFELPDAGCRGLFLVVQPSGAKSWAVRYRHLGRTRKLTLGPVLLLRSGDGEPAKPALGAPLTVPAARALAADALHQVQRGGDPADERVAKLEDDTFQAIAEDFLLRREGKNLRSAKFQLQDLTRLVFPVLGRRKVRDIRR